MNTEPRPSLANFAVALAAGIAMVAYAGGLVDPAAAAETHYLAVWATLVLIALAGLALPPAYDLVAAAVLTTLVVWVVPHGPVRGAAVGLLLTLGLVAIALRHLDKTGPRFSSTWTVAAALGLQILCRADRLLVLAPEPSILIGVVALPVGAAIAVIVIQRQRGIFPALLAASTAALLVPGWSVMVTLSVLVVALGLLWRDRDIPRWMAVAAAVILLLAANFWHPTLAWLLLLALLAAATRSSWKTGFVALAAVTLLLVFLPPARDWSEVLRLLSLGPLLLPALLLPVAHRRIKAVQGLLLAVLALRVVAGPGALAAPLVLVALSVRSESVAARLQMVWSGALLVSAVLLAAYPWLRSEPLEDALGLFGIRVGWPPAIAVVAVVWALSLLCAALAERSGRFQCRPVAVGAIVLALAAWISLPSTAIRPLADQTRVLSDAEPELAVDLEAPAPTNSVVIDTYMDNSSLLATGTPVGRLTLVDAEGERQSWLLRLGHDTGEWAARRDDVANLPGFESPPHWVTWVTPSRDVFGQRYRANWSLKESAEIVRVELARAEDLPTATSMAVFHLELRR